MSGLRKLRAKRAKINDDSYITDYDQVSETSSKDDADLEEARKSRIRDSNREFARRMSILQTWSDHWTDYETREGEAYPQQEAREIVRRHKKISCPIATCKKTFTSVGGLKYHYARCNIEKSFKCKVCEPYTIVDTRGDLLRHMIRRHMNELPTLNTEQQTIANGYLARETRTAFSKKDTRLSLDIEPQLSTSGLVEAYRDLQQRVFRSEKFLSRPYKDWQTKPRDWDPITHIVDRRPFYPPETNSVKVKLCETRTDFVSLKAGESIIYRRDHRGFPISFLFYTGGINTSSTWLPKSLCDPNMKSSPNLMTVAVNCCFMNQSYSFKETHFGEGNLQFWTLDSASQIQGQSSYGNEDSAPLDRVSLSYMVGHNFGTIFEMSWCPLGTSWQPQVNTDSSWARIGLLALACGDGQIRILSVPHTKTLLTQTMTRTSDEIIEGTPIFRVNPVATLLPPGVGPSTNYQTVACKSLSWSIENDQRFLVAGYSNGSVALFDLSNVSPILYNQAEHYHTFRPLKSWFAHGGPVTTIAISHNPSKRLTVASGSLDRQLRISNPMDLNSFLSFDRAPITRMFWDFRFRGVVTATDSAFTSFSNRITYKYPHGTEGSHNVTISTHRATVFGLAHSIVTGSAASGDQAGEVFVQPHFSVRPLHKRDRAVLSTHSLYSITPFKLPTEVELRPQESAELIPRLTASATSVATDTIQTIDSNGSTSNLASLTAMPTPDKNIKTELAITTDATSEHGEDGLEADADFSKIERSVANKPNKFIIPLEHRPVSTYTEFKKHFGLEFQNYNWQTNKPGVKLPESCTRALDLKEIYCDRPCDYPVVSVNNLTWSPNSDTFPYLLAATQNGLCRLDLVEVVEQMFQSHVNAHLKAPKLQAIMHDDSKK